MHTVLANKGPLVLAYQELAALSDLGRGTPPALRFSGAVGGALPTINVGRRDLAGGRITRLEAVLNSTTQLILELMTQGYSYEAALAEAQQAGIAEPDPALDVQGWDHRDYPGQPDRQAGRLGRRGTHVAPGCGQIVTPPGDSL
jgi:homoserine dehydrogenase